MDAEAGPAAKPVPEMAAQGVFFEGKLEAEVLLSRGGFGPRGGKGGEPPEGGREGLRGGFSGGFGGGFGKEGGHRGGGPGGESRSGGGRDGDGAPVPHIVASNQPPVRLHLRLTNKGTETAEVEVLDFRSDLGNFVVQPRKLTLTAGQTSEVDPMTSQLGVQSDALELVVRIRQNGKTEQQALTLAVIPGPPGAKTGN
jgi:hypothetical protein